MTIGLEGYLQPVWGSFTKNVLYKFTVIIIIIIITDLAIIPGRHFVACYGFLSPSWSLKLIVT